MSKVRVRFAPSPTGALHIGGVRTALYNYLFAKKNNGDFILRIEDTDKKREVQWAENYINNSLNWLGIEPDESPNKGGDFGPYKQSDRSEIYRKYALQLVEEGKAYYAFDTAEELDAMRERLKVAKASSLNYNAISRTQMKNSLTLSDDEVERRIKSGEPYVIRICIPLKEEIRFNDLIRGWVVVHSSTMDDKVLLKSDGLPTYHLANIVDDHLMKVTHVIRGEEWLPSAPLHVLLYQFLGWEDTMPSFAHLPLILKPDGNGKLSKRDAEKHGFPIFPLSWKEGENMVQGFKETGYYPDAFLNFLALLGWNPGTEQEIFSIDEMIDAFSIEKINKSGAKFDIQKAEWFNQQYLKNKPDEELVAELTEQASVNGHTIDQNKAVAIVYLMKDRVTFSWELYSNAKFFFHAPEDYDQSVTSSKWTPEAVNVLKAFSEKISSLKLDTPDEFKQVLLKVLDEKGVKMGKVMQALRVSLTGEGAGPDLMGSLPILGNKEVAERIQQAISTIKAA
ncbi:MAG: glutamate--tRNA ligase [Cyclobacteriaceae bacterium]